MIARVPSYFAGWGRLSLVFTLAALPVFSCTSSEDTEPFVPAVDGAKQPDGKGDLISEDEACDRLLKAAQDAYDDLGCDEPAFPDCPAFLRPGAGSGCYAYREGSITACEEAYKDALSCRNLSPCIATAEIDTTLPTCEQPVTGTGGADGDGNEGGSSTSGGAPTSLGGGTGTGGDNTPQGGSAPVAGQSSTGGAG